MTLVRFSQIAEIIWQTTAAWRAINCHGIPPPCPTSKAPYGNEDPQGRKVHEDCIRTGCLDLVHDVLEHVHMALKKDSVQNTLARVSNPGGYVRKMVMTRLSDLQREDRVRRGFPAKPSRNDGAAGRVAGALRAEDGARGEWLVRVFRILRSYPFGPNHVAGRWPVSGLIQEYTATNNGSVIDEAQVLSDIKKVLQIARQILGETWVYDNLTLPVWRNGPTEPLNETSATTESPIIGHVLSHLLLNSYSKLRGKGCSEDAALQKAVRKVCGVDIEVTQELRDALEEFKQSQ